MAPGGSAALPVTSIHRDQLFAGAGSAEGDIFRGAFGWGVALLAALRLFVYLPSTPVLGWMVR